MKIIALGDTHGRANWKKIVSETEFDKIIFIGDYFDTHEGISPYQQKSNFLEIIEYKRKNLEKVILLLGNHDYHYLKTSRETYSGFQTNHKKKIQEMLHSALDLNLIQMCFSHKRYIFTHAGVTKTWLDSKEYAHKETVEQFINNLFIENPNSFDFTMGINFSETGDDVTQSPIWVRPKSLIRDCIEGYTQIVGHTTVKEITKIEDKIILIDTLGESGQFISIAEETLETISPI